MIKGKTTNKLLLEKLLPHFLVLLTGYCLADLLILNYRDLMLPQQPPPAPPQKHLQENFQNRGAYNTLINRNIFASNGIIPDALMAVGQKKSDTQSEPVLSSLPMTLRGTIVHSNPQKSIANIEVKSKSSVMAYTVGHDIEGLATLVAVERNKVIFNNTNNSRLEFLEMKLEGSKLSFGAAKIPAALNPATEIMQTAPNKFEIKRSDVLKYTADMSAVLQQAAMAPRRNAAGEIDCFRFLSIQPDSIYTKLGFQNGDCIKSVNGERIDSPAKAMELYGALKTSSEIKMQLERDGRDQDMNYLVK